MALEDVLTGMRRAAVVAIAVIGLTAAGCGDDDDDGSEATTTTGETVEETTTTVSEESVPEETTTTVAVTETTGEGAAGADSEQAAAEAAMLVLDDFVSGWQETPADAEDEAAQAERQATMAACLGVDTADLYRPDAPQADSPTFVSQADEQVSSSLNVAPSVDDAAFRFATLTSDEAFACIASAIQETLATGDAFAGADVQIGEVTVNRLSVAPVGDESTAARTTMPLVIEGTALEFYFDNFLIRAGRALISVEAQSPVQPFPIADLELLGGLVFDRVDPMLLG